MAGGGLSLLICYSTPTPSKSLLRQVGYRNFRNSDWLATQSLTSGQKLKRIEIFVLSDTSVEIAKEAHAIGLTPDEMRIWVEQQARTEIKTMPTLGLFSEILQQKHLNSGANWTSNDSVDLMYLTCAAGYADYVVGDNSQISQIEQALRRLGRPKNVYRNLRDLVIALEADKIGLSNPTSGTQTQTEST